MYAQSESELIARHHRAERLRTSERRQRWTGMRTDG